MSHQSLQHLCQIILMLAVIIGAGSSYGIYYFGQKIEDEKSILLRPTIDICRRGISVIQKSTNQVSFDIPYCSGKNANAYNVNLESAIILKENTNLIIISNFEDTFPENITLTYETGKAIQYTLNNVNNFNLDNVYIVVKGSFTNENNTISFPVLDSFKYNSITQAWVRLLGDEDRKLKLFLKLTNQ